MREIVCDACNYRMTLKEYEDLPECPNCWGHYVTEIEVVPIINGVKLNG